MKTSSELKKSEIVTATGNCVALRRMLAANPDRIEDARFLSEAALHGRAEVVKLLLSAGADADGQVPSHEHYRPLHRAIEHRGAQKNPGHREIVELLLEAGASLEKRATWMQLTPLAVAGMTGDGEFVSLLIERKASVDLFTAAIIADEKKVRAFLKRKPSLAQSKDTNHMTVLHYAALCGLKEKADLSRKIATALLEAGADGDARESIGPYPPTPVLHFAAWKNYAVAETLLERGCDPNAGFGTSLWGRPGKMAGLFLTHGANVNLREPSGQPLLNSRIHWNLPSVALWLLENGADPNATDKEGNAALHEAAARGINADVVKALIACGARRDARNRDGETSSDIARRKNRAKLIGLL